MRLASVRAEHLGVILREHPEFAEQMARFAADRRVRLVDLTAKARPGTPAPPPDTHSSLLREILRFFKLPGQKGGGEGGAR